MIDPQNLDRIRPAVVRRLLDMKSRTADILHVRIDDTARLIQEQTTVIEAQAKEIERLRKGVK